MSQFNTKYLEEVSGGNKKFIEDMLLIFLTRTPEAFEIMKKAIADEDWQTLGFYAHKLKATYAYVGLDELKKILIELEYKSKNSIDTHTLEELLDYLINMTQPELTEIKLYKTKLESNI